MNGSSPIFLDASGLVAVLNADDWLHDEAAKQFEAIGESGRLAVTTDLILGELANGLARTPARAIAADFIQELLVEPKAKVVFVDESLLNLGLAKYTEFADKTWGLVDCISFVVMESMDCTEAFTHDHHFSQAGFKATLR